MLVRKNIWRTNSPRNWLITFSLLFDVRLEWKQLPAEIYCSIYFSVSKKYLAMCFVTYKLLLTHERCPAGNKMSVLSVSYQVLHVFYIAVDNLVKSESSPTLEWASGCSVGLARAFDFRNICFLLVEHTVAELNSPSLFYFALLNCVLLFVLD